MATLHIEHEISDLDTWRAAFGRFAEQRAVAGVRDTAVRVRADDRRYVVVDLGFDSADAAYRFLEFLQAVVWSTPANSPALIGAPRALVLEDVPVAAVVSG